MKKRNQYAGNMKFSRYIGTTPTIIIPLFGRDCKDVAGAIFCRIVGKGRYQNLLYMMERCRIFAVCKAGGDGVAIHSKCGMLFSLLHKDLLFNSRQQGKASAS